VHDAAVHAGDPGVDHPAGVLVGELGEVAEHGDDVVHVDPALHQRLAGVEGLGARDVLLVAQQ